MNTRLMTTVTLRQHLKRAYDEVGEELWPIMGKIIREIQEENQHVGNDQDRFDHECGPRA